MYRAGSPDNAGERSTARYKAEQSAVWIALIVLVVLSVIDVVRGPWDHDGGHYLHRSSLIAEGWRPYLDYNSIYPPLLEGLHAIPIAAGFDRYLLALAIPVIWILLNTAASVAFARSMRANWLPALLAGSGFLLLSIENGGNHVTMEHGVVFFSLVALASISRQGDLTSKRLFVCGLALACAVLSKQNGAVAVLPLAALLFERRKEIRRKPAVIGLAGFGLPFVVTLAWLGFAVVPIVERVTKLMIAYSKGRSSDVFSYYWEFVRSGPTVAFLALTAAAGLLAVVTGPRRLLAATSLAAAAIEFAPRLIRNYPHYTLAVWPFALIVIMMAARSTSAHVRLFVRGATTSIMAVSVLYLFLPQSIERWEMPGYLSSLLGPAAESVRDITPPDGRVRIYAAEPIIPYLAERLPDEVDLPDAALALEWDGSHSVEQPIPEGMPLVVGDRDGSWVAPLRERIHAAGYETVFDRLALSGNYRVTVYKPGKSRKEE